MEAEGYHSKPQKEEFFVDSGYYKFHEAYHLLKFPNEKEILKEAYEEYKKLKSKNQWGIRLRRKKNCRWVNPFTVLFFVINRLVPY